MCIVVDAGHDEAEDGGADSVLGGSGTDMAAAARSPVVDKRPEQAESRRRRPHGVGRAAQNRNRKPGQQKSGARREFPQALGAGLLTPPTRPTAGLLSYQSSKRRPSVCRSGGVGRPAPSAGVLRVGLVRRLRLATGCSCHRRRSRARCPRPAASARRWWQTRPSRVARNRDPLRAGGAPARIPTIQDLSARTCNTCRRAHRPAIHTTDRRPIPRFGVETRLMISQGARALSAACCVSACAVCWVLSARFRV